MKYISGKKKEKMWDDYDPPLVLNHLAVEGPVYIDTGLYGPDGHPIYRLPIPIGFGRDEEW